MPTTVIAIPLGTGSFTIPADFPSGGTLQVECVGAGGLANSGGGAYSKTNAISGISALQTVYIQVGNTGTDTWFNKTSNAAPTSTTNGCLAKAGTDRSTATNGAPGGQASAGIGDVKYSGGNGGTYTEGPPDVFGGGGGAAGPNGAGANAAFYPNNGGGGANGGSTGSGSTGGNGRGGTGGGTTGNGSDGGGGAGATISNIAGNGGVDLIWTDFAGVQWGPCGGGGGNRIDTQAGGEGYGGGACRLSDVGTSFSSQGLIILTYTTGSASASFVDAAPFINQPTNNLYTYLGYWYIPYGVTSLKVECVGAANNSGVNTIGGGAYATRTLTLTPGGPLYLGVGSTLSSIDPDTWVNPSSNVKPSSATNTVLAKGTTTTTGGASGSSFGSTVYSGGNAAATANVAGNGGSAGPNGAGANGGTGATSGSNGIGGGGGAANGGSVGSASGTYTSRNGGAGGASRLSVAGGSGATTAINATDGSSGSGGGGGSLNATPNTFRLAGCGGVENIWTTTKGEVYGVAAGAGGRSRLSSNLSGYVSGGVQGFGAKNGNDFSGGGLIVFTYTYTPPVVTNNGNFFMFF